MNYLEFSRILTIIASMTITFGVYSQAYKMWRTKSVKDFSGALIFAIVFTEFVWLNYGLAIKEWPIIVLEIMNIPGVIITSILFLKYKK